jgi:hypothetical protein
MPPGGIRIRSRIMRSAVDPRRRLTYWDRQYGWLQSLFFTQICGYGVAKDT